MPELSDRERGVKAASVRVMGNRKLLSVTELDSWARDRSVEWLEGATDTFHRHCSVVWGRWIRVMKMKAKRGEGVPDLFMA